MCARCWQDQLKTWLLGLDVGQCRFSIAYRPVQLKEGMTRQAPWAVCRHLGWAAQWLEYEAELRANLSRPALTVPVFEDAARARLACLCVPNQ